MFKKPFILVLILWAGCAAVWLWASVALWQQEKSDKEFQQAHAQAPAAGTKRVWTGDDLAWIEESLERAQRRHHLRGIRSLAITSGFGIALVWLAGVGIYGMVLNRRWAAPGRQAYPEAGAAVKALLRESKPFVGRERGGAQQIEIDAEKSRITFRHFSFVTSFWRNPRKEEVELGFNELLVVTFHTQRGVHSLRLRTTRGAVVVYDRIEPFEQVVRLIVDIAELNRVSPEQFRLLLQRELKVKTPWYAWLIFAGALSAVGVFGWWLWGAGGR